MKNINLNVALHTGPCSSIQSSCIVSISILQIDKDNVVQNVNVIFALHLALCGSIPRVIALTLYNI